MSFFEHYNMGIPLFVPSLDFLTSLHMKHHYVQDRTCHPGKLGGSGLPVHPAYNGSARVRVTVNNDAKRNSSSAPGTQSQPSNEYLILDPNNDFDERALRYWLSLSDFYTFPHVAYFNSVENLVDILEKMWREPARLLAIHETMRATNRERLKSLLRYWRRRLLDIAEYSPHKPE